MGAAGRRLLICGGCVLTLDRRLGDFASADVLVEDGSIVEVGPRVDAGDADVVEAEGMIVMPGFVDSHRHTWESLFRHVAADATPGRYFELAVGEMGPIYRPEDVYAADLLGALEALDTGITTLFDWATS